MKQQNQQLTDRLAAEYVLGTLKGRARQRFERWLAADLDGRLHDQVQGWELRLNKLAAEAVPQQPPAELWQNLERRLFDDPAQATAPSAAGWLSKLNLWRGLAAGSSLLAGVLAVLLWFGVPPQNNVGAGAPNYVVLLQNRAQQPIWSASAGADLAQLRVRNLKPISMPADRGCLLWVQPAGSNDLYPLGLLPDDGGVAKLDIAEQLRAKLPGGKLMVTLEDRTNRPSAPTGAAEFVGQVVPLSI